MNAYPQRPPMPPYQPYPLPPQMVAQQNRLLAKPVRANSNVVCGGLLLLIFFTSFVWGALDWYVLWPLVELFPEAAQPALEEIVDIFGFCVPFGLCCLFMRLVMGMPRQVAYPLRRPRASILIPAIGTCLGLSLVGSYVSSILSSITDALIGMVPTMPDFGEPIGGVHAVLYVFNLAVVPAVYEEMVFRGVVMQSLRRFGDGFALVVSALLFAMLHGNLVQGPNAMIFGLAIGYFVLRTGSLITGMVIHFINNFIVGLFTVFDPYMSEAVGTAANVSYFALCVLGGLSGTIFLLTYHRNMFRVPICRYPLGLGRRYAAFFIAPCAILFTLLIGWTMARYFQ